MSVSNATTTSRISAASVVGAFEGGRGDGGDDVELGTGRGRGGNIEEGTAGSRCQRLRAIGGPQHAQATSRSRIAESTTFTQEKLCRCL